MVVKEDFVSSGKFAFGWVFGFFFFSYRECIHALL